ncbi:MAG TPA: M48 family metalloprotease [Burkholderiales bacterium]|nr:M48 family metalloprotease [Burkholderiales bacterium]
MRVKVLLLVLVLVAVPRAYAGGLPDLGDPASAVLSPRLERHIGEQAAREIRSAPSYIDDPEIIDYLDTIGNRLVAAMPSPYPEFQFLPIRNSEINAFAMPGGFVGVNSGLIMATDNESELAAVLAHEITHVTQNHIARMLTAQQRLQLPTMLALAAAIIAGRSRPDLAVGAAAAAQGGVVQSQLAYSREFEREADRIGFERLVKAGFDPRAMGQFFEKLQSYTRLSQDGSIPAWLQDHPLTPERIADAENRAADYPYRQHVDSVEYGLVRTKLRAEEHDPRDAVSRFSSALSDGRYANEADARYGLVVALLRADQPRQAEAALAKLRVTGVASPMIETLAARVAQARSDRGGALELLKRAHANYPYSRILFYAYAGALEDGGQNAQALKVAGAGLQLYPHDARLYGLKAKAYAALGKGLLQHQAQAEVYYLEGSLPAAIEQLQLARAAGDGSFYDLSMIDARLRDLRAERKEEQKDDKQ